MKGSEALKLTPKQKAFADYFIQSGNATQSAIKAGYSEKTAAVIGNENLMKPYLKNYIDEQMQSLQSKRIADSEEVLQYLTKVMRGEFTEEAVVTENIGDFMSEARTIEKDVGAKDRIKAAELLGKRYSLFTDKVETTGNIKLVFEDDYGDNEEN